MKRHSEYSGTEIKTIRDQINVPEKKTKKRKRIFWKWELQTQGETPTSSLCSERQGQGPIAWVLPKELVPRADVLEQTHLTFTRLVLQYAGLVLGVGWQRVSRRSWRGYKNITADSLPFWLHLLYQWAKCVIRPPSAPHLASKGYFIWVCIVSALCIPPSILNNTGSSWYGCPACNTYTPTVYTLTRSHSLSQSLTHLLTQTHSLFPTLSFRQTNSFLHLAFIQSDLQKEGLFFSISCHISDGNLLWYLTSSDSPNQAA